tara:strand:+ start:1063 stop:1779 length:717 start_codon:yes stop_codon:yes gene_type:complete
MDPNIRPYSYFVLKNEELASDIDLLDYTVLFGLSKKIPKYRPKLADLRVVLFEQLDALSERGPCIEDVGIITDAIENTLDQRITDWLTLNPSDKRALGYSKLTGYSISATIYYEQIFHHLIRDLDLERRKELLGNADQNYQLSHNQHPLFEELFKLVSDEEKKSIQTRYHQLFQRDQVRGIAYQNSGLYLNKGDKNQRANEIEKELGFDYGGYKFSGKGTIEGSHQVNAGLCKIFGNL